MNRRRAAIFSASPQRVTSTGGFRVNTLIIPHAHFHALRRLDCEELQAELDRADVMPAAEVPDDVVTMHSRVHYVDETTGDTRAVTLVYPDGRRMPLGNATMTWIIVAICTGHSAIPIVKVAG